MKRIVFLILFICAASAPIASGSAIFYTNRAAWEAAAHPTVTLEFEGIAPAGGTATFPSGFTQNGVTIAAGINDPPTRIADDGIGSFISAWGTGDMIFGIGLFSPGSITFSTPVFAFGFDYGATFCTFSSCSDPGADGIQLDILDLGVGFTAPSVPMPPLAFIGVISDTPITSATFLIHPSFGVVDRFAFVTAVPEPTSMVLLASGLFVLAFSRRRRAQQQLRVLGERISPLMGFLGVGTI